MGVQVGRRSGSRRPRNGVNRARCLALIALLGLSARALAAPLPELLAALRPGVVGIASYDPLGAPRTVLGGTGFAVGDGRTIVTNAHVVHASAGEAQGRLVVLVGRGEQATIRPARLLREDRFHDLALLAIEGPPVPPLRLAAGSPPQEGEGVAFTGFPIGAVLGLYPVTHRGIISCVVPLAVPQAGTRTLSSAQLKRLNHPFEVFQLDAVAYPGNSGSPVYELAHGEVVAILNSVLVKAAKESVLKDPSAIAYAIPVVHLKALLAGP